MTQYLFPQGACDKYIQIRHRPKRRSWPPKKFTSEERGPRFDFGHRESGH